MKTPDFISTYLQLPLPTNTYLHEFGGTEAGLPAADPPESSDFQHITGVLVHQAVHNLWRSVPAPGYCLGFVRGSIVQSRLEQARSFWPRVVELFELSPVLAQFERRYSVAHVAQTLASLKKEFAAELLYTRRAMGPAKLLLRKRHLDEAFFARLSLKEICALVEEMSTLLRTHEGPVRSLFADSTMGKAAKHVRVVFHHFVNHFRLQLGERHADLDAFFRHLVEWLAAAQALHPLLPMTTKLTDQVAAAFQIEWHTARQIIALLRFSWLTAYLKADPEPSDIALKCEVIMPHPAGHENAHAEIRGLVLDKALSALIAASNSPTVRDALARLGPDMTITTKAALLHLPAPLYDFFIALDQRNRLNFITKYNMGRDYFYRFLHNAGGGPPAVQEVEALWPRITHARLASLSASHHKNGLLPPHDLDHKTIVAQLESAIRDHSTAAIEQLAEIFNKIIKDDRVDSVAGMWAGRPVRDHAGMPALAG